MGSNAFYIRRNSMYGYGYGNGYRRGYDRYRYRRGYDRYGYRYGCTGAGTTGTGTGTGRQVFEYTHLIAGGIKYGRRFKNKRES